MTTNGYTDRGFSALEETGGSAEKSSTWMRLKQDAIAMHGFMGQPQQMV